MKKTLMISALAVAIVFSVVALATADIVTYNAAGNTQTGNVAVSATVNPKITLTINTPDAAQSVAFGALDPGATASKDVTLTVSTNKAFNLTKTVSGQTAEIGLTTSQANLANVAKGQNLSYTDTYSVNVPWSTEPGNYTANVQYTVTQTP